MKEMEVLTNTGTGHDLMTTTEMIANDWYIHSGASFHCTSQRNLFDDYTSGDFGQAFMGNGHACEIIGKGTVTVKIPGGGSLHLNETRHIPDLKANVISTGALDEEGYGTIFGCGEWKITLGEEVIARGKRVGKLYRLQMDNIDDMIATTMAIGVALNPLAIDGPESRPPSGTGNCTHVQDR